MAGAVKRLDSLSETERSIRMSKVRSKGNRSTELVVEDTLRAAGVRGWRKHPKNIPGRPDFYFPKQKFALFVDGCFWHACPRCARRTPVSRAEFWSAKIDSNRRRDTRVRRLLVRQGFCTMRVWEHQLRGSSWLSRLMARLLRLKCEITLRAKASAPKA